MYRLLTSLSCRAHRQFTSRCRQMQGLSAVHHPLAGKQTTCRHASLCVVAIARLTGSRPSPHSGNMSASR